jgi:hypothetical protein
MYMHTQCLCAATRVQKIWREGIHTYTYIYEHRYTCYVIPCRQRVFLGAESFECLANVPQTTCAAQGMRNYALKLDILQFL